ncbi:TPA: hypothetical protein EYP66_12840 [Candidatus Poribacteria bacterium]|nr:hypothetical protein [Candidatus Poribacteria bacterium]
MDNVVSNGASQAFSYDELSSEPEPVAQIEQDTSENKESNELDELGEKIFLDRYALKDMTKSSLAIGDTVIVCVDLNTRRREIGKVKDISDSIVTVELRDGTSVKCTLEHVDKPIELKPEQMMDRVARGIAAVEDEKAYEWFKNFRWMMNGWKFVPAGRILTAAGTDQQLTYYNCFVLPSPHDSREGIVKALSQMMEIMSRGGGVGINLSSLRPRHCYVKGVNGRSSGAVSWGGLFSFTTGLIEQGGSRRGALILVLNDWHPDLMEFIKSKRKMGQITNANISVAISDDFMAAVKADADWNLEFPDTLTKDYDEVWEGDLQKWKNLGKPVVIYKTLKARQIWDTIIESAWASGEPGVWFIDRANQMSNSYYFNSLSCVNPCVVGETLVSTDLGWRRAEEITEGDEIATVLGRGKVKRIEYHKEVEIFKVTLSDGAVLRVTAAHQFHAIKRHKRSGNSANKHFAPFRLDELSAGDYIRISPALMPDQKVPGKPTDWEDREYGFALGLLIGDGSYTLSKLNRNCVSISCDARETEWIDIVESTMKRAGAKVVTSYQNKDSKGRLTNSMSLVSQSHDGLSEFIRGSLLTPAFAHEKTIPLDYINTNRNFLAGLIDGLFSTDGSISLKSHHPIVRFKTSSFELAQSVRRILLMFGIHGRVFTGARTYHEIDGRRISDKRSFYELCISGHGLKIFAEEIGLTHPHKSKLLRQAQLEFALTGSTWLAQIKSIIPDGTAAVYDVYESESDTWITEGAVSRGCGEEPLPAWSVCDLGAINLAKFVVSGDVDWETLSRVIRYAVRFLDNVIEATPYFFEENHEMQLSERRIGLNTMGLAEMLIRLGIRYGSKKSLEFIDKLYKFITTESYLASVELAVEKGAFPKFDAKLFLQSGYMLNMPDEVRKAVEQKGIRNATLLTQAPNGCVTPDTLVFADGALKPIAILGDHDGPRWQDVSFTTYSDSGPRLVKKFYVNGYHEVVEITTGRGFKLAATLQHRVRVIDDEGNYEWRQMGELQPGDTLVMARGGLGKAEAPKLSTVSLKKQRSTLQLPEVMTPELAELLGFYIGDGYLKERRGLGIAVDACDVDVVGRLQELIGQVFNLDARIEETGRNCLVVWAGSYSVPRWMRANGLAKSSALDAQIPEPVLAGGAMTVAAFLRGLFESDGSISEGIVTFVTASERLAREVQIALLGLGIVSTRRSIEPSEGRYGASTRHEVRLLNSREVLQFRELVGFVSKRKQTLLSTCEDKGGRGDSIPSSLLRKIYTESEGLPTDIRQDIAGALRCGMTQGQWHNLVFANPALEALPSAALLNGHLFFDVVTDINLDNSFTFDLSVPETNTYIANGIVAHNTIGTMVGTSTGIEPFYFWNHYRQSRLGTHEVNVNVVEEWKQKHPGEKLPPYFVTAMDLTPEEHVRTQAAIQRWLDASISKTCNTPNDFTIEQMRELYELMYELGCKGGTVYRDGSRDEQVLKAKEASETEVDMTVKVRPRPYKRQGVTVSQRTPSGTAHITMNNDESGQPFEVFVEIGKGGSDIKAMAEAMGRLMSLLLRLASPVTPVEKVQEIVNQIRGIGGARSFGFGKDKVLSLPDAVGKALEEHYGVQSYDNHLSSNTESSIPGDDHPHGVPADICPVCGHAAFVRQEGCMTCHACGYSEC